MDLITMRKAALVIAAFVAPCVVVFLATAFVNWSLDASTWSESARFFTALFGVTWGCVSVIVMAPTR